MQIQQGKQSPKTLRNGIKRPFLATGKGIAKIRSWWHMRSATEQLLSLVFVGLLVVGCILSLLGTILSNDWPGLLSNLGTGFVGTAITLLLIDILVGNREKREAKEQEEAQLKAELVAKFGSSERSIAIAASEELRWRGWLSNGLLQGEYLLEANLEGAVLVKADLQKANLSSANLQEAQLISAHLQNTRLDASNLQRANLLAANLHRAKLSFANLRDAKLQEANLQEAELVATDLQNTQLQDANLSLALLNRANLQGAVLHRANLQGAKLHGTNLQGADLEEADLNDAKFDESTILPNGKKWTLGIDMTIFIAKK